MKTTATSPLVLSETLIHTTFKNMGLSLLFIFFIIGLYTSTGSAQTHVINYSALNIGARDFLYYPQKKQFIINSADNGDLGYLTSNGEYTVFLKDSLSSSSSKMLLDGNFLYVLAGASESDGLSNTSKNEHGVLLKVDLLNNTIVARREIDKLQIGADVDHDLAIDSEGAIYIIDALSPVIHKIKSDGSPTVLMTDKLLASKTRSKSIAYHKNGYLLVAVDQDLYKIDLTKNNSISTVLMEDGFDVITSINFTPNHLLVLSEGGSSNQVHILNSSNSWASGKVLKSDNWKYNRPGEVEFVSNKIYVLDSQVQTSGKSPVGFLIRVIDLQKRDLDRPRKFRVAARN